MEIFLNLLASLGLCWIMMYGTIFDPYRKFISEKFIKCALCVGFWTGAIVGLYVYHGNIPQMFLFSFASSAFCFLMDLIKKTYLNH